MDHADAHWQAGSFRIYHAHLTPIMTDDRETSLTVGCIFGGQAPNCTAHSAHEKIKNPCSATRFRCSDSSLRQRQRLERRHIGISGWKDNKSISLSCSRRWAPKDPHAEQTVAKQWLPEYQRYRIEGTLRTLRDVFK